MGVNVINHLGENINSITIPHPKPFRIAFIFNSRLVRSKCGIYRTYSALSRSKYRRIPEEGTYKY